MDETGSTLPTPRSEALKKGVKHYFTGKPCVNGHVVNRQTSNNACVACQAARQKAWDAANRERKNLRAYEWNERNPDKVREAKKKHYTKAQDRILEYARLYREANPEKAREASRKWQEANRERFLEMMRIKTAKWIAENPERHAANQRTARAKRKSAEGKHTAADIKRIRQAQKDRCGYCKTPLRGKGHIDHKQPLSKGGSNWPDNIQILCKKCNLTKRDRDPLDFARSLGLLL